MASAATRRHQMGVNRGRCFTLIELLVVITIIAILASMLLPAITAAKNRARTIACLSQTKQHLITLVAYSADNDDAWPQHSTDSLMQNARDIVYEARNIVLRDRIYPDYISDKEIFFHGGPAKQLSPSTGDNAVNSYNDFATLTRVQADYVFLVGHYDPASAPADYNSWTNWTWHGPKSYFNQYLNDLNATHYWPTKMSRTESDVAAVVCPVQYNWLVLNPSTAEAKIWPPPWAGNGIDSGDHWWAYHPVGDSYQTNVGFVDGSAQTDNPIDIDNGFINSGDGGWHSIYW